MGTPVDHVIKASRLIAPEGREGDPWSFDSLAGRVSELSEELSFGALTFAVELLSAAQERSEPAAWVSARSSLFFPPDLAENGIDLSAVTVVAAGNVQEAAWAADLLARSGAFGLLVVDIGRNAKITDGAMARLVHLARRYHILMLFLTEKRRSAPSLSSLISVHAFVRSTAVERPTEEAPRISVDVTIVKDKRRAPGVAIGRKYEAPAGVR